MHRRRGTSDTAAALRAHFHGSAFTTTQAEEMGISARRLAIAADAGVIRRVRRGLYLVGDLATPDPAHLAIAHPDPRDAATAHPAITDRSATAATPDPAHLAVAHHIVGELRGRGIAAATGNETAASEWNLPHDSLVVPTIRVPRGSTLHVGTRHGVRVREGDVDDVVSFRGHWLTSPLATARDISRGLPRHHAVALFGLAQRRYAEWLLAGDGRMDAGDLTAALADPEFRAELSQAMYRMLSGSARRQLWSVSADPRPETYLEGISWGRFTGWRLGDMTPQAWVRGASGRRYRVDVLIDGIAGEADGAVKYASTDTLWKEKRRQDDIEEGGTPVVRWTFAEAEHHPDLLLARWRKALRRHAA
jgi:hypothetical protein